MHRTDFVTIPSLFANKGTATVLPILAKVAIFTAGNDEETYNPAIWRLTITIIHTCAAISRMQVLLQLHCIIFIIIMPNYGSLICYVLVLFFVTQRIHGLRQ